MNIVIAVGHGRSASGAYDSGACWNGREEFKIAREIAKYASLYLNRNGHACTLINYEGNLNLSERIKMINLIEPDIALEIHLNAGGGTGTEVFYPQGNIAAKVQAQSVVGAIAARLTVRNRGAKVRSNSSGKDYYAIIRCTHCPTLLVETAFIDCDSDMELLGDDTGLRRCGKSICDALRVGESFLVKVRCERLNVRTGPGTQHKINTVVKKGEVFTVTATQGNWGRLKSGAGWVRLGENYAEVI